MSSPAPRASTRAFTLVEILVVLACVAVLLGTLVGALRPGSSAVPVRGAQAEVAALLVQARQTAQLEGREARLLLSADPADRERYLRFLGIVYDGTPAAAGREWRAATDGITLPRGVYAVPPGAVGLAGTDSRLRGPVAMDYGDSESAYWFLAFAPDGTVSTAGGSPRVAVGRGRPEPGGAGVVFGEPDRIRGVLVRRYGAVVLLDGPRAFPGGGRP